MEHLDPEMRARLRGSYGEIPFISVTSDVTFGDRVLLSQFVNLYGCTIGDDTRIGAFTEIGKGVKIGARCKIGAHVFIPEGVTIEDEVFIGPRVTFTNDRYPQAVGDWTLLLTLVKEGASIGAGTLVLPGLTIGKDARIAAGSLVLRDIPDENLYRNPRTEIFGVSSGSWEV